MKLKPVDILLTKPFDHPFTYLAPEDVKLGDYVKVPFRNEESIGVVWSESKEGKFKNIKEVIKVYTDFNYPEPMRKFTDWVAKYNMAEVGKILKMSLSAVGVIEKPDRYKTPLKEGVKNLATLSKEQSDVVAQISAQKKFKVHVIDGVTGSGKTEVYLHLIDEVIKSGGQALVLLPEIVLTSQLITRFKERLGIDPCDWHSELGTKTRKQNWLAAANGEGKFFVGARSGLFLPFKNLKLIIVDEEHDQSFKQEEGVIYNARDMAIIRAKEENIPILLCSATPSVETIHNVRLKKYKEYKLPSRYGVAVMPEVKLIDMHKQMMPKGKWISAALKEEMIRTYNQGKQSLLFLNRRGYAPATYCGSCHEKVGCPNCNFLLVEHRNKKILQCHYCGHKVPPITQCPFCGSSEKIYSLGPGVERIAEEVSTILPQARVAILASDTTPDRKNISELIDDITNHKVDIIVGTQMITKGLHFPQLHLVGVIDAEGGIFGCDIRAVERTYQLLHQVSGRAGREKDKGIVLLQTYEPESHLLKNLVAGNANEFIRAELDDREVANMPPFSRLALITATSSNELTNMKYMQELAKHAPEVEGVKILGPSPSPLFVLRRKFRHRFVIVANKNINIQKLIAEWIKNGPALRSIKLKIDIDPISFA